jgi:hypothetical protein
MITHSEIYKVEKKDYKVTYIFLLSMLFVYDNNKKDIFSCHIDLYNEFNGNMKLFVNIVAKLRTNGISRRDVIRYISDYKER